MRSRTLFRDVRLSRPDAVVFSISLLTSLAVLAGTAGATILDFSAALQNIPAGAPVGTVTLPNGATMHVTADNTGDGPDLAIVFDSAHPTGDNRDLGTPNEDFGGPGIGAGGHRGKPGENAIPLGNVLIIADNDADENGDGLVDDPENSHAGVLTLKFSHAGRVALTFIDFGDDDPGPRLVLFDDGNEVGEARGHNMGNNGAQHLDLASYGDIDQVEIHMRGSHCIGAITVDVPVVGVDTGTWSKVKSLFR